MKTFHSLALGTLLLASGFAVSVQSQTLQLKPSGGQSFQLVESPKGFSFETARTYFQARARQTDGLYRGINIHTRSKDPMRPEDTLTAYARFGRRDAKKANRWILGDVVLLIHEKDGTQRSQARMKRLLIDLK